MHKLSVKQQAIKLRTKGYSIKEIARILGIAQSTSSVWSQRITLSEKGLKRLNKRQSRARGQGAKERNRRLSICYRTIENLVIEDLIDFQLSNITKRLLCAFLYWGEGAKTGRVIKFMNSDPEMIKVFLRLFRESFVIDESKLYATLHLHEYHNTNKMLLFWSKLTKIPKNRIGIYRKPNSGNIIREGYPGCISINYGSTKILTALTSYYKFCNQVRGGLV